MTEVTRRGLINTAALGAALAAAPVAKAAAPSPAPTPAPTGSPLSDRLLLDLGWRFALGHAQDPARDFGFGLEQRTFAKAGTKVAAAAAPEFDDSAWSAVRLPHDWAVDLPFTQTANLDPKLEDDPRAAHGFKPLGREYPATSVGWYRRTFDLPAADAGRRLSLEFDGVFRDALVMVNGYVLHRNESGYAPFRVDFTDVAVIGGKNLITVRVDASLGEGWFYEGAGIYRHVWLMKTNPLHIPQHGVFVRSEVAGDAALVSVSVEVANESDTPRNAELIGSIWHDDYRVTRSNTFSPVTIAPWSTVTIELSMKIDNPTLWSPDDPWLYVLGVNLFSGEVQHDQQTVRFGVRTLRFDAEQGFFLNGEPVKLKGTCNHQDHAGLGVALPDRMHAFRIERLKEMGSNAYRAAHDPPAPELLDACDQLGMLVIDETRRMSSDPQSLDELERMVRRDRNRPSVILWSIGNEEQAQQGTERGAAIARTMRRLVDRLDGTRPITAALDGGWGDGVSKVVDVLGFNYRTDKMEAYHRRVPGQPIIGTETGSTVSTRGAYIHDDAKYVVVAYDREHPWWASTAEEWWTIAATRPYIAGGFIWTGFDYRGEPTPFNKWPSVASYFGVMDSCGFAKDNYHYYRAWWRPEPALHLLPHWTWPGREGQEIEVWAHSNLDRVELFLNGRPLGARDVARNRHVEWRVAYQPGVLEARGWKDGRMVLTERRETAGPAARIVLTPDRQLISADSEDVSVIEAHIVDAKGRPVPDAGHPITFMLTGDAALIGVGNGDPTSLEPDKAASRRAFNGLAMAILQAGGAPGPIRVLATSPGLKPGLAILQAESRGSRFVPGM
ncbi:MAG: glycoside hydrolase family 2 sugar binding protein [Caulobacter sp.]|nr:glycoside hydrolase family 2 sugar binding protein [Caulobacter sp.]